MHNIFGMTVVVFFSTFSSSLTNCDHSHAQLLATRVCKIWTIVKARKHTRVDFSTLHVMSAKNYNLLITCINHNGGSDDESCLTRGSHTSLTSTEVRIDCSLSHQKGLNPSACTVGYRRSENTIWSPQVPQGYM